MARTKQTARKSTGGAAPRKQLASNGASSLKSFMRSQQATGHSARNSKKIFINYENTMGSVLFQRQKVTAEFQPTVSLARVADFPVLSLRPSVSVATTVASSSVGGGTSSSSSMSVQSTALTASTSSSLFMRLDFNSVFDGNEALIEANRDALDAVFVLDISGSMQSTFADDSDKRCKLQVAKDCITKIASKLKATDKAALVIFNNDAKTLIPLKSCNSIFSTELASVFETLKTNGGTDLANGLCHGFNVIRDDENGSSSSSGSLLGIVSSIFSGFTSNSSTNSGSSGGGGVVSTDELADASASLRRRMKRVFFLTDMESSHEDELEVIRNAKVQVGSLLPPGAENAPPEELALDIEEGLCGNAPSAPASSYRGVRGRMARGGAQRGKAKVAEMVEAVKAYSSPVFLSVICIGVDLSIDTVERISSVPGAKYCSVVNASELEATVAGDFAYDVTPIAFNIEVKLPDGLTIEKQFGSAELNNLKPGSSSMTISSEFAVPLEAANETSGGVYLIKLNEQATASVGPREIQFSWTDRSGQKQMGSIPITMPSALNPSGSISPSCDIGLRKAYALTKYVDLVTEYVTTDDKQEDDEDEDDEYESDGSDIPVEMAAKKAKTAQKCLCPMDVAKIIVGIGLEGIMSYTNTLTPINFPDGVPVNLSKKLTFIQSFNYLRHFLVHEMAACGDLSLESNNSNILQTIDQIITIETKEVASLYSLIEYSTVEAKMAVANDDMSGQIPRGFMCPVTLAIMVDPVLASDGHSYERKAIEAWLAKNNRSPVTNLELPNAHVVPNFALRAAIEEYVSSKSQGGGN